METPIFSKIITALLLLTLPGLSQMTIGGGVSAGGGALVCVPPTGSAPVFSPAPGTYSSPQTVTMTCPSGKTGFYRTDGGLVTIASPMYTAPLTVSSSQTFVGICATLGAYQTNLQSDDSGAACGVGPTPPPSTTTFGPWTCQNSGGTGTVTPSNLVWTFGTTNTATITAPASTGSSVQALFKWQFGGSVDPSAPTCDTCTEQVKDIKFTVIGSGLENQEFDSPQYDSTHGNTDRQNGTQCQGSSGLIEVDSGNAGGWTQTTASCSSWTAGTTHEVVNRVDHDLTTGICPGGNGCALYKYIWADGVLTNLLGNYCASGHCQGYNNATGKAWGWQFQPDMKPTSGSAVTGGWTIISATVALGIGDESPQTTAAYNIVTPGAATPVLGPFAVTQMLGNNANFAPTTPTTGVFAGCSGTNACLPFQKQVIHTASPALPIAVNNCSNSDLASCSGTGSLTVTGMTISGTNAGDFALGGTTTGTITSGGHLSPTVTFTPSATAGTTETATLTVNYSGATVSSQTMSLSGISLASATSLSACGTSFSASSNYVLTADVSATGTCFTDNVANVDLNLNGHTITYCSAGGTGNVGGIYVSGFNEQNLNVHGGSIVEAAGKTCTGLNSASYPQGSSDFMVSSDGSSSSGFGNKFINVTLSENDAPGHNIYDSYAGASTALNTVIYNANLIMNGVFNCSSGNVGCRAGDQFYSVDIDSAQNATTGDIVENVGQVGGTQGAISPAAAGSTISYNVLQTGNATATNSNGFTAQAWASNAIIDNNLTDGTGIGGSCLSCRGIQIAAIGSPVTGVTVKNNVERVTYLANNNEYGGCSLGGSYGAQINTAGSGFDVSNNLFQNNRFIATAGACIGIGFSDSGATVSAGVNKSVGDTLGCNVNPGTYVSGTDCAGIRLDALQYSPAPDYAIEFDGDTIYGDLQDISVLGTSARQFKQDTFGKGSNPQAGFLFVDYDHGFNTGCGTNTTNTLQFIDPTFINGVTMSSNDLSTWAGNNPSCTFGYTVAWTYTITVEKSSNSAPISGATVSVLDSTSTNQCSTTTNSSGIATCTLKSNGYQAVTGTYSTPTFNPMAITVTASGCTTGSYSETITATTTETKKLSGC